MGPPLKAAENTSDASYQVVPCIVLQWGRR